jgi:hypothetical protein
LLSLFFHFPSSSFLISFTTRHNSMTSSFFISFVTVAWKW